MVKFPGELKRGGEESDDRTMADEQYDTAEQADDADNVLLD